MVVVTGGNPAQLPCWHVSTEVMGSPSSQAVPSTRSKAMQPPVLGVHAGTLHDVPAPQVLAPLQMPA